MYTTLIIILCAVGAFAVSLTISFLATRKLVSQRLHYLSEFVPDELVEIEQSDYCMATDLDSGDVYILGFGNDEISLFRVNVIGGDFKVQAPLSFKADYIRKIELTNMRTSTSILDVVGNTVRFSVSQLSSREVFAEFPCDIDLGDSALRYYDFVEQLKVKVGR